MAPKTKQLNSASFDAFAAVPRDANSKPMGEKSGPIINIESDYSKI